MSIAPLILRTLTVTALALGVAASCKSRVAPDEPSGIVGEVCCKVVSEDLQEGAGCRIAGRCRSDEPIWMRGAITCSRKDPETCNGGRCCKYRKRSGTEDAIDNPEGESDGESTPTPPAAASPNAPAQP